MSGEVNGKPCPCAQQLHTGTLNGSRRRVLLHSRGLFEGLADSRWRRLIIVAKRTFVSSYLRRTSATLVDERLPLVVLVAASSVSALLGIQQPQFQRREINFGTCSALSIRIHNSMCSSTRKKENLSSTETLLTALFQCIELSVPLNNLLSCSR